MHAKQFLTSPLPEFPQGCTVDPERRFRCSALPRVELCPGSPDAEAVSLQSDSADAMSGRKVHKALERAIVDDPDAFNEPSRERLDALLMQISTGYNLDSRQEFILVWFAGVVRHIVQEGGGIRRAFTERAFEFRFFVEQRSRVVPVVLTGHTDLMLELNDDTWHVVDYKTGFAQVDTAEVNLQGYGYLVGADFELGIRRGTVHLIVAGNDADERHTFAEFDAESLSYAFERIYMAVERACFFPFRQPSLKACRYCSAKCTQACPETAEVLTWSPTTTEASPEGLVLATEPEKRLDLYKRVRLAQDMLATITGAFESLVDTPLAEGEKARVPGLARGKGAKSTEITNAAAAFVMLRDRSQWPITSAGYNRAVSVALGTLCDYVHELEVSAAREAGRKKLSQKAVREAVLEILTPILRIGERKGSLKISMDSGEAGE